MFRFPADVGRFTRVKTYGLPIRKLFLTFHWVKRFRLVHQDTIEDRITIKRVPTLAQNYLSFSSKTFVIKTFSL